MQFKQHKFLTQKGAYALFCVFVSLCSFSQSITNLINNYSFEQYNNCPFGNDNLKDADYWFKATIIGSPDYMNPCATNTILSAPMNFFGNQVARSGNSYVGFGTYANFLSDFREYIETKLQKQLKPNVQYCITYYISFAEISRFATANIGIYFSKDSVRVYTPTSFPLCLPYITTYENSSIITDTINWVQQQTTYTATGIENFITIGCFKNDASITTAQIKPLHPIGNMNYSYYYIDDVTVIEINPANAAIKDSLISRCFMDSVMLGTDSTEFATYTWSSTTAGLAALSCTNCPNPIAKPLVTTKYYLTKQQCSATTKDSVTVVVLTPTTQANAGNSNIICEGDVVQLGVADSASFVSYSWQGSGGNWQSAINCTYCAQPLVSPMVTTTYTVQRTECTTVTTDTVKIIVGDCDPTFVLPNVFTPNYDGVNDTWGISFSTVNEHIKNFKMSIYNRWGLLVYSTNSELNTPNSKWDGHTTSGEECSEGVYYYIVTFEKNEEHILLKGHLSLFR